MLRWVWLFMTPWTAAHQTSLSITISWNLLKNSGPSSRWYHPTISFSVVPFSSCPQSFPASGSFPVSQLFASGGQRIRTSASPSVHPTNIQGWFPLGLTGLILSSKGLSRDFSSTSIQKHQFFHIQSSLWSNSHIHTWLLEKPQLWLYHVRTTKWQTGAPSCPYSFLLDGFRVCGNYVVLMNFFF